jgi:hypothetical protein
MYQLVSSGPLSAGTTIATLKNAWPDEAGVPCETGVMVTRETAFGA